jgi:hypothetical protein
MVRHGAYKGRTRGCARVSPPRTFRSGRPPAQSPPLRPRSAPARPPRVTPAPTPIRRRGSPITASQAFVLETTSKRVSAGVEAVARAPGLVLATEFLGGHTGGQGQSQGHGAKQPCELHPSPSHSPGSPLVRLLSHRYALAGFDTMPGNAWHERFGPPAVNPPCGAGPSAPRAAETPRS